MIKKSIKLIILVIFTNVLFAQHTFEKIISDPENQIINRVIEDDDGNFIMAGRIRINETANHSGYLIKINNDGNLMEEKIITQDETISSLFLNIHFYNNLEKSVNVTT